MLKKHRIKIFVFSILLLILVVFIVFWENHSKRQAIESLEIHADVIADALWKIDSDSPIQYLSLATRYNNYKYIQVYLYPEITPFIEIEGSEKNLIHSFLVKLGLIRMREIEVNVSYFQISIGKMQATAYVENIYLYLYWTLVSILLGISLENVAKTVLKKRDLEKRVMQKTEDFKESEERYITLVENIPGVAYRRLYDESWTMLFISDGIQRLSGYESSDFINNRKKAYSSIMIPWETTESDQIITQALEKKEPFVVEYKITNRDGSINHVYDRGQGVYDREGKLRFIDGVIIDITEKNKLAQEKTLLEEQYHQSQKMESIGRLAGGMAHDLNNLLTPVLGYSDLIALEVKDNKEVLKYTDEIINASLSARELIQQLLSYSRKQQMTYKEVHVNEIFKSFRSLLRGSLHDNVTLHFDFDDPIPPVQADKVQLEQVIMNLAINAQDAMEGGGTLTISTGIVERNEMDQYETQEMEAEKYLRISYSDTGTGMSEDVQTHIFEPFFSTKGTNGTGLGLATVFGIIKQHKGFITVESKMGLGTTIHTFLPA